MCFDMYWPKCRLLLHSQRSVQSASIFILSKTCLTLWSIPLHDMIYMALRETHRANIDVTQVTFVHVMFINPLRLIFIYADSGLDGSKERSGEIRRQAPWPAGRVFQMCISLLSWTCIDFSESEKFPNSSDSRHLCRSAISKWCQNKASSKVNLQ